MTRFWSWFAAVGTPLDGMSDAQLAKVARRQWTLEDLLLAIPIAAVVFFVNPSGSGILTAIVLVIINQQHRLGRRIDAVTKLLERRK